MSDGSENGLMVCGNDMILIVYVNVTSYGGGSKAVSKLSSENFSVKSE